MGTQNNDFGAVLQSLVSSVAQVSYGLYPFVKTEFGSRTKCAVARFRSVRASLDSATSRNIAIQLVLQQCCKNKLHVFCCPFIRSYLKIRTNHNRVQLRKGGEHWVTPARVAAKETTNSTPGGGVLPYMT